VTQMRRIRKLIRVIRFVLLLVSASLLPPPVWAQTNEPPALHVTIADGDGQGIGGVTIQVTDRSGGQLFARVVTDSQGGAMVALLPTGDVRVQVSGQWHGMPLSQTGADAQGVLLLGGDPPLTLDLRVTPDGQVIPDPTTMIAPDGVDADPPIPTAPIAASATPELAEQPRLPEATTLGTPADAGAAGIVEGSAASQPVMPESPDGTTLAVIGVCLVIGLVLLIIVLRWGRPA